MDAHGSNNRGAGPYNRRMYAAAEAGPGLGASGKEGLPAMPGAPLSRPAYFVTLGGVSGVAAWDCGEVVLE